MTEKVTLNVSGLKCGGCESNVKNKLNTVEGVQFVDASSKENSVTVEFEESKTSLEAISQAITEAGFTVE